MRTLTRTPAHPRRCTDTLANAHAQPITHKHTIIDKTSAESKYLHGQVKIYERLERRPQTHKKNKYRYSNPNKNIANKHGNERPKEFCLNGI